MKIVSRVVFATLLLASSTQAENFICGKEAGCTARINDDGELKEESFRKGDIVDTAAGWVVSPDDGWEKIKKKASGACGGVDEAFGPPTLLQDSGEVGDGTTWTGGGVTTTIDIQDGSWSPPTDVGVRFKDPSGWSPLVPGSGGATSTPDNPTTDDSAPASTPGGNRFKVVGKYVYRLGSDGRWYRMRQNKKASADLAIYR